MTFLFNALGSAFCADLYYISSMSPPPQYISDWMPLPFKQELDVSRVTSWGPEGEIEGPIHAFYSTTVEMTAGAPRCQGT